VIKRGLFAVQFSYFYSNEALAAIQYIENQRYRVRIAIQVRNPGSNNVAG